MKMTHSWTWQPLVVNCTQIICVRKDIYLKAQMKFPPEKRKGEKKQSSSINGAETSST